MSDDPKEQSVSKQILVGVAVSVLGTAIVAFFALDKIRGPLNLPDWISKPAHASGPLIEVPNIGTIQLRDNTFYVDASGVRPGSPPPTTKEEANRFRFENLEAIKYKFPGINKVFDDSVAASREPGSNKWTFKLPESVPKHTRSIKVEVSAVGKLVGIAHHTLEYPIDDWK